MATRHRGPEDEVRALDTYIKLMRAAGSLSARIHRHLAEAGLTVTQFAILEVLFHLGALSQRDIGRKLLMSGGNITLVVDNLERRALVRRERVPTNRRMVHVHLTPDGRRLIARVFPRHARTVAEEMAVLSADEQATLGALCRRLGLAEGAAALASDHGDEGEGAQGGA
jgi:MarR family 2-MHQ and catechol resistance regulon transcriptional repressor